MTIKLDYTTVATAIGEVAIWWSGIEKMAHGLATRLALLNEPSLDKANCINQLNLILINVGQREVFAAIKALAFHGSPDDIYPRLEPILNDLDNNLRNQRNRFMHDSWFATGEEAQRTTRSLKIVSRQSRTKEMQYFQNHPYASFDELDALARHLKGRYTELEKISDEISARIAQRKDPRAEPQQ